MKLENIGFYTLSDARAKFVAEHNNTLLPFSRCEIIITNKCNFNCPYCRGVDCDEMTFDDIKRTIDAIGTIKNIRFSGGEPTLNPFIEEAVSYAKKKGVERIAISTNGSLPLNKYKNLLALGVNDFSISLDACCASTGDMMAGNKAGSWNRVVSNIKELSALTYVTVGIVVTEQTINEVIDVINFAHSLGVSDIRVIPSSQFNKFLNVLEKIDERIYRNRPILKYRIEHTKRNTHVRGIRNCDTDKCPLVLDDIAIKGDNHYPCIIYMRENGAPIGNISDGYEKIHSDRRAWFKMHDCKCDEICRKNCLDVCIDYNNICMNYME